MPVTVTILRLRFKHLAMRMFIGIFSRAAIAARQPKTLLFSRAAIAARQPKTFLLLTFQTHSEILFSRAVIAARQPKTANVSRAAIAARQPKTACAALVTWF